MILNRKEGGEGWFYFVGFKFWLISFRLLWPQNQNWLAWIIYTCHVMSRHVRSSQVTFVTLAYLSCLQGVWECCIMVWRLLKHCLWQLQSTLIPPAKGVTIWFLRVEITLVGGRGDFVAQKIFCPDIYKK